MRYYEKKGLIRVNRDNSGRRCYSESDVEWIKFIKKLKDTGMMGLAGEIGWKYMQRGDGNSAYRSRIIDAVYNMTEDELERGAKYEVF